MKLDVHLFVHLPADDSITHTLAKILTIGTSIMSKVSDFAAAQTAFNTRLDAAVSGISSDVADLNAKIQELQTSAGAVTAEDQALLDELQAQGEALATRFEAVDALTPPPVPAAV